MASPGRALFFGLRRLAAAFPLVLTSCSTDLERTHPFCAFLQKGCVLTIRRPRVLFFSETHNCLLTTVNSLSSPPRHNDQNNRRNRHQNNQQVPVGQCARRELPLRLLRSRRKLGQILFAQFFHRRPHLLLIDMRGFHCLLRFLRRQKTLQLPRILLPLRRCPGHVLLNLRRRNHVILRRRALRSCHHQSHPHTQESHRA